MSASPTSLDTSQRPVDEKCYQHGVATVKAVAGQVRLASNWLKPEVTSV